MASADEYAAWIVKNADKKGTPEFDTVAAAYKVAKSDSSSASSTQPAQESGFIDNAVAAAKDIPRQVGLTARYGLEGMGNMLDLASSPIRGALNLVTPKQQNLTGLVTGTPAQDRFQSGSGSRLADMIGLPKPQGAFEEGVGTVAKSMAMGAVPVAGANAVSGLVRGGAKNIATSLGSNAGNQIASAGVSGAVDAVTKDSGLNEPTRTALSMASGLAVPVATNALAAGRRTVTGPGVSESTNNAVNAARDAGYVVPPTQGNPSLANRAIEGFSGKLTTAQNASAKNQAVTDNLAKQAIGLPADQAITPAALKAVRDEAGKAYEAIGSLPVRPATVGSTIENRAAAPELDPKKALFDLRQARNDATGWYENYKRTASPDALKQANQSRSDANRLEKELEDYAKSIGRDDLIPALAEARQLIAKTYSVEKAMNPATGTIDASKLSNELKKGKPLSDQLKQIAEFGQSFPKAVQTPEKMGSLPGVSPLDFGTASAVSGVTANPMYMAGVLARPLARKLALSDTVQNRLRNAALANSQSPRNALMISPVLGMPSQNDEQR
jgi:hypothetical protein